MRWNGLWRQGDFRKLWAGQAISRLGSSVTSCALPLAALLTLGASPMQMGILSGVNAAAVLGFGLFAGAWADRLRKRPLLIAADLGRAVILATIPLAAALHRLTMSHLYFAAAAGATLTVLFDVSYQAWLPSLVGAEHILEGNSKLALAESGMEIVGPGLAGVLTQWVTAPIAILLDAVSFVCSALSVWLIRKPEPRPAPTPQPHIGREISAGLAATWRSPILRAIAKRNATASFFGGFFGSLYFLFAIRDLKLSPALVGAIIGVGGATALSGAFLAAPLARKFGFGRTIVASAVAPGLGALLLPLAHGSVTACAALLTAAQLSDVGWTVYNINETSLRQAITPGHLLGRVNAGMHLMFHGILPVGALAGGILAQAAGVRNTMLAGAMGLLLSNVWLVFSPIGRMRELPQARSEATA